jgi:hypothetical protein
VILSSHLETIGDVLGPRHTPGSSSCPSSGRTDRSRGGHQRASSWPATRPENFIAVARRPSASFSCCSSASTQRGGSAAVSGRSARTAATSSSADGGLVGLGRWALTWRAGSSTGSPAACFRSLHLHGAGGGLDATLVDLDTLLAESDIVSLPPPSPRDAGAHRRKTPAHEATALLVQHGARRDGRRGSSRGPSARWIAGRPWTRSSGAAASRQSTQGVDPGRLILRPQCERSEAGTAPPRSRAFLPPPGPKHRPA